MGTFYKVQTARKTDVQMFDKLGDKFVRASELGLGLHVECKVHKTVMFINVLSLRNKQQYDNIYDILYFYSYRPINPPLLVK